MHTWNALGLERRQEVVIEQRLEHVRTAAMSTIELTQTDIGLIERDQTHVDQFACQAFCRAEIHRYLKRAYLFSTWRPPRTREKDLGSLRQER